ncbi:glyoxalase [beta proteobacterium AAP99]|nr:glyoxalase [beta proteobacterium AAP99]
MLHHLSFGVADIMRSARFYDAVLGALGQIRVWEDLDDIGPDANPAVGYGTEPGNDLLALKQRNTQRLPAGATLAPGPGFHVAFSAQSRGEVDAFHAAALAHGGLCNGPPGLRPDYGPHYYAAFVIDPDGYRIEAVINRPVPIDP